MERYTEIKNLQGKFLGKKNGNEITIINAYNSNIENTDAFYVIGSKVYSEFEYMKMNEPVLRAIVLVDNINTDHNKKIVAQNAILNKNNFNQYTSPENIQYILNTFCLNNKDKKIIQQKQNQDERYNILLSINPNTYNRRVLTKYISDAYKHNIKTDYLHLDNMGQLYTSKERMNDRLVSEPKNIDKNTTQKYFLGELLGQTHYNRIFNGKEKEGKIEINFNTITTQIAEIKHLHKFGRNFAIDIDVNPTTKQRTLVVACSRPMDKNQPIGKGVIPQTYPNSERLLTYQNNVLILNNEFALDQNTNNQLEIIKKIGKNTKLPEPKLNAQRLLIATNEKLTILTSNTRIKGR